MSEKNSFILYAEYGKIIEKLSMEERGELITAIFRCVNEKEVGALSLKVDIVFSIICAQLERDIYKYRDICAKRAEYGRKGGKANQSKLKQTQAKQADNDNDSDYDNDDDNEYEYEYDNDLKDTYSSTRVDTFTSKKTENALTNTNNADLDNESVAKLFNAICVSQPNVQNLTPKRRKAISAARKALNGASFEELFKKAESSDFLSGRNGNWAGGSFDWLLKPTNLVKVLEGNYDNQKSAPVRRNYNENLY